MRIGRWSRCWPLTPKKQVGVRWRLLVSSTFMDRYIEQDCTSTHMKDAAQALADEQMSKVARDFSPACATVCLSGATIRSWLVTVARARLPRSRRDAVDMADGLGTKQTHATLTMSTSASESSGRRDAIEADIAACCRKGFRVWEKSKIRQSTDIHSWPTYKNTGI